MTKIPTLYDKLKPRVRAKLKENEGKYSSSVRQVIATLESSHFVGDLTIDQMRRIHLFSDTDYVSQTALSIIWGDEIFEQYDREND
jgi:hypothetical protein